MYANAEILIAVSDAFSFAALTVPSGYWEIAPGVPAYYWLPEEARFRQVEVLQEVGVGDRMLVGNSGGVMSMPGADQYVEFAYRLYDAPEEIDQMAQQVLHGGLEMARRFRDLGVEAIMTASDIADNRGVFPNPQQMDRFFLPYLREWAQQIKAMGGVRPILNVPSCLLPLKSPALGVPRWLADRYPFSADLRVTGMAKGWRIRTAPKRSALE